MTGMECAYPSTRDRAAYSRHFIQNFEARLQALERVYQQIMHMAATSTGGETPAIRTPEHHHTPMADSIASREWSIKSKRFDVAVPEGQVFSTGDAESGQDICSDENPETHQKMNNEVHSCLATGLFNNLPLLGSFPQRPKFGDLVNDNHQNDETAGLSNAVENAMFGLEGDSLSDRKLAEAMVDVFFSAIRRKKGRGTCMPTASRVPKTTGKRKRLGNARGPAKQSSVDHRSFTSHCSSPDLSTSPRTAPEAIDDFVQNRACGFTTHYEASESSVFSPGDCPVTSKYPILSGLPMDSVYGPLQPSLDLTLGSVAPKETQAGGSQEIDGLETLLDSWTEADTPWTDMIDGGAPSLGNTGEQKFNTAT
jgi:hypothetical protein